MKIMVSTKAAKKLKLTIIAKLDEYEPDIYCWRLDYLQQYELFMITNEKTCFTHLISAFVTFEDLVALLEPKPKSQIQLYRSNNRRIIGTMTEMKYVVEYAFESNPAESVKSIQDDLNNMVYSFTNYESPGKVHKALELEENSK